MTECTVLGQPLDSFLAARLCMEVSYTDRRLTLLGLREKLCSVTWFYTDSSKHEEQLIYYTIAIAAWIED